MTGRRHDLGVTYEKYQFQNTWILWPTEKYWNKHVLFISFGFLQISVRITKKHLAIPGPRKWKSCWSVNKDMDCTGAFVFLLHRKLSTNSYQNTTTKHVLLITGSWKTWERDLCSSWECNPLLHSIILQHGFGILCTRAAASPQLPDLLTHL